MTFYEKSIRYIDKRFKRKFIETKMTVEQICDHIDKTKPEEVRNATTPSRIAWNRAMRNYKLAAMKAYPERANKVSVRSK